LPLALESKWNIFENVLKTCLSAARGVWWVRHIPKPHYCPMAEKKTMTFCPMTDKNVFAFFDDNKINEHFSNGE